MTLDSTSLHGATILSIRRKMFTFVGSCAVLQSRQTMVAADTRGGGMLGKKSNEYMNMFKVPHASQCNGS